MTTRILILAMAGLLGLSACGRIGESRLNPFNWFGRSEPAVTTAPTEIRSDPRPLVAQVTELRIEQTPTGAVVRATGLPPTQGWYAAALVPETDGPVGGEMTYSFRAIPPEGATRVSTPQSRELSVAVSLSTVALAETRVIRVVGARNALVTRR